MQSANGSAPPEELAYRLVEDRLSERLEHAIAWEAKRDLDSPLETARAALAAFETNGTFDEGVAKRLWVRASDAVSGAASRVAYNEADQADFDAAKAARDGLVRGLNALGCTFDGLERPAAEATDADVTLTRLRISAYLRERVITALNEITRSQDRVLQIETDLHTFLTTRQFSAEAAEDAWTHADCAVADAIEHLLEGDGTLDALDQAKLTRDALEDFLKQHGHASAITETLADLPAKILEAIKAQPA